MIRSERPFVGTRMSQHRPLLQTQSMSTDSTFGTVHASGTPQPTGAAPLCPVCERGSDHATPVLRHDRWTLLNCPLCEVVFLDAPPTHADLAGESRWSASFEVERETRRKRRPVLSAISRRLRPIIQFLRPRKATNLLTSLLPAGGTVVDVGCGDGARLDGLPASFTPLGIEIDPGAAAIAAAKFASRGGRVLLGAATEQLASLKPRSLDAALLMAYLEHETRPIQALRLLRSALKPDAPVVIKVPNHESWNRIVRGPQWCGYRFPDHVMYFSPSSLRRTLRHAGFRIFRFGLLDRLPTSDNMWMVARA